MSRTPIDVFDVIRKSVLSNRSQFYRDLTLPFFGYNRRGAAESEGVREHFWLQGMTGGIKGHYDCEHEFSEVIAVAFQSLRDVDLMIHQFYGIHCQPLPTVAQGPLERGRLPRHSI